jgi:predicted small secreted protein
MKRKPVFLAILLGLPVMLGGNLNACNTIKGAGQDIKSAGQAIERKAEAKKSY